MSTLHARYVSIHQSLVFTTSQLDRKADRQTKQIHGMLPINATTTTIIQKINLLSAFLHK